MTDCPSVCLSVRGGGLIVCFFVGRVCVCVCVWGEYNSAAWFLRPASIPACDTDRIRAGRPWKQELSCLLPFVRPSVRPFHSFYSSSIHPSITVRLKPPTSVASTHPLVHPFIYYLFICFYTPQAGVSITGSTDFGFGPRFFWSG